MGSCESEGAFTKSDESYNFKHPILLPKDSHLTALIIDHFYLKSGYNGMPYVIKELSKKFFTMGQEKTVKNAIKTRCMACRNRRAGPGVQIMSPLPFARVQSGKRLCQWAVLRTSDGKELIFVNYVF